MIGFVDLGTGISGLGRLDFPNRQIDRIKTAVGDARIFDSIFLGRLPVPCNVRDQR